jgi:hypothetical protein
VQGERNIRVGLADGAEPGDAAVAPPRPRLEREALLLLAVLEDAVACYVRHAGARRGRSRQAFEEARQWLESTDRGSLFTCESICDALGIDTEYLRRGLRERRARRTEPARRPPPRA